MQGPAAKGKKSSVVIGSIIVVLTIVVVSSELRHWSSGTRVSSRDLGAREEDVPSFQPALDSGATLPPTLNPKWFHSQSIRTIYSDVERDKQALRQLPCYCFCDKSKGHRSLLDCFVDDHGAHCVICLKEAVYAHRAIEKGIDVADIRSGIIHGEWHDIDLGTSD